MGRGKRRRQVGTLTRGGKTSLRGRKCKEPKWKENMKEVERLMTERTIDSSSLENFVALPISSSTKEGLRACGYAEPTDIQKAAIPLALAGKDVLGAAKTGSGKTLAFLVPLLELLWRERWSPQDGVGAIVISPTRELAYQTFEVLRRVGAGHDFSAGLVTGGKDVKAEKDRILHTNILVCTPGRLLQHMDETVNFECSSLKMLVLDEADRILDLGFEQAMNAIIQNLPADRQTLLFSATQTKSVRDLARLSLADPQYVAVHENSKYSTPHKLVQNYVVCELPQKLNMLYSFIKSHLGSKVIVFMSSCKQVKFTYEAFRRMRPGTPLMALYGRQKHLRRMGIYNEFCKKKSSVLLCTDIAARGLDIPSVDWVVQLDCPEDANTYIHRAGRTARYEKGGKSLLFLLPSEVEGMLKELQAKKIPIEELKVNPKKTVSIVKKLSSFCAMDVNMKQWAKRSFICYLRSVHLQSNKSIFDVRKLPIEEFALSLGLPAAPRVRFLQRSSGHSRVKGDEGEEEGEEGERDKTDEETEEEEEKDGEDTELFGSVSDGEEESQVLFLKRVIPVSAGCRGSSDSVPQVTQQTAPVKKPVTKVATLKKLINKNIKLNSHVKFDEEGVAVEDNSGRYSDLEGHDNSDSDTGVSIVPIPISDYETKSGEVRVGGIVISQAQRKMSDRDKVDRKLERERIKTSHKQRRLKKRKRSARDDTSDRVLLEVDNKGESDECLLGDSASDLEEETSSKRLRTSQYLEREGHHQLGTTFEPLLKDDEELAKHLLGL